MRATLIRVLPFALIFGATPTVRTIGAQSQRVFDLVEELRIAPDERCAEGVFSVVNAIHMLGDGRIVTSHGRETRLRVFDAAGKSLAVFGRAGKGPGEFTVLTVTGFVGDRFWALDGASGNRIVWFDTNGSAVATQLLPPRDPCLRTLAPLSVSVRLQARCYGTNPDSVVYSIVDDAVGSSRRLIATRQPTRERFEIRQGRILLAELTQPLFGSYLERLSPGGRVLNLIEPSDARGGAPGSARLIRIRMDGTMTSAAIDLPVAMADPARVDDYLKEVFNPWADTLSDFLKQIKTHVTLPTALPAVQEIIAADDSTVWVRRVSEPMRWFMLGPDGRVVATVRAPRSVTLLAASRTKAWGVQYDSDGVPRILRFRLVPNTG